MRRRKRAEDHDSTDRWVVSYADFITLLFAFFTTMYAISHVDLGKLEKFAGSMRTAFKSAGSGSGSAIIDGIKPINYADIALEREIITAFERFERIDGVNITRDDRGVIISFGDSVLFDTASADIRDEAKPYLSVVASLIRRTQNPIVIEGHTDNVPIKNGRYPSNWELSTARATSVLVYFLKEHGIDPERFSASGYGQYRPVATNTTPEGRAKNRRVDIVFVSRGKGQENSGFRGQEHGR